MVVRGCDMVVRVTSLEIQQWSSLVSSRWVLCHEVACVNDEDLVWSQYPFFFSIICSLLSRSSLSTLAFFKYSKVAYLFFMSNLVFVFYCYFFVFLIDFFFNFILQYLVGGILKFLIFLFGFYGVISVSPKLRV
jgi:hypothetical protein